MNGTCWKKSDGPIKSWLCEWTPAWSPINTICHPPTCRKSPEKRRRGISPRKWYRNQLWRSQNLPSARQRNSHRKLPPPYPHQSAPAFPLLSKSMPPKHHLQPILPRKCQSVQRLLLHHRAVRAVVVRNRNWNWKQNLPWSTRKPAAVVFLPPRQQILQLQLLQLQDIAVGVEQTVVMKRWS